MPPSFAINGKEYFYTQRHSFLVQVGYGPKGSYTDKHVIMGEPHRAALFYNGINIGKGYKKRLVMRNEYGDSTILASAHS